MTNEELKQRMNELLGREEPVGRLSADEINTKRNELLGRDGDNKLEIELGEQAC